MHHYTAITEDIKIEVRPVYIDGQSDIMARKFVFAYYVKIRNQSGAKIQLERPPPPNFTDEIAKHGLRLRPEV